MKSLKINARITEVADTATRLLILYKRETALANDPILKPLFIEALKTAQNVFNERRVTYGQELALQNTKLKSADLKKRILERINVSLLAYLTSVKSIKNEQYTHFIEGVNQIITDTNSAIIARSKKPENNTPPASA